MSSSPTVSAPPSSSNPPALYVAMLVALPAVAARLRAICLRGWLRPSWQVVDGVVVAFVKVEVDVQSDTFFADLRRAYRECKEILIDAGFAVGGQASVEPQPLRVASYFGAAVTPEPPASAPASSPAPEAVPPSASAVSGMLSRTETFAGMWVERWVRGPVAERRVRQLRRAFGASVTTRSSTDSRKLWSEPGAERTTVQVLEVRFVVPRGASIPAFVALEVAA